MASDPVSRNPFGPAPGASLAARPQFEVIAADQLSEPVLSKIVDFLDTQDSSHPFQFPQWLGLNTAGSPPGVRFALSWEGEKLRWFARCGTWYPLGAVASLLRVSTSTRGPVCDDVSVWPEALRAFVEQSRLAGFAYAEIGPELPVPRAHALLELLGQEGWEAYQPGRVSLRLNISQDEDHILAGFRKTTRYEVHKAERAGISIEIGDSDPDISRFLKMHAAMAERKSFSPEPSAHLRNVLNWLVVEPQRGALLVGRHNGNSLGGVVIVRAGKRCWYVWGATEKQEGFSVGHLLQWKAILWAKAHGCTEYDLGGYREGATSGPALFKHGFGGEVVHFVAPHHKVIRTSRYRLLQLFSKLK